MACDMCGKTGTELETIRDTYKTKDIQMICPDCEKLLNKHLRKLRDITDGFLKTAIKRFMQNYKEEKITDR